MPEAIVLLIQTLPTLIELVNKIGPVLDQIVKAQKDNTLAKWISDLEESVDKLATSKTDKDKIDAAQRIVNVTSRFVTK